VIEDAAEALGSIHCGRHCGSFGQLGVLSFNGNKICTTGGGGAILTNDAGLAKRAKHLCTTAKQPHPWNFYHDEIAWNLRLPNLNAALGCAQLERLWDFVAYKRRLANAYQELFMDTHWIWMSEQQDAQANYWLCAVLLQDRDERDSFLKASNDMGVMTRPAWDPLHTLPMYQNCLRSDLTVTVEMGNRLVNLPSGVSKDITCAHGLENISTALAQRLTKNVLI
jgi:dTDP-4-amino-4,6-dideoxygalactose transaminase